MRRLRRQGEILDRVADRQQLAEAAQQAVTPEVQERLQSVRREVEQQKRGNARLQSERLRLSSSRKAMEKDVRAAGISLRAKAALLQTSPSGHSGPGSPAVRQLQQELDILRGAMASDERKLKSQADVADKGIE